MVVGEVGEDRRAELQSGNALLLHADRADFHEAVFAAGFDHVGEQGVEGHGVGGRVGRLAAAGAHVVGNRGEQAAFVAEVAEEVVEQGHGRGLAVGAGDAHEAELAARVAVEGVRGHRHRRSTVFHDDISHIGRRSLPDGRTEIIFRQVCRKTNFRSAFRRRFRRSGGCGRTGISAAERGRFFARAGAALRLFEEDGGGAGFDGLVQVGAAVVAAAVDGNEQRARPDLAGVVGQGRDLDVRIPLDGEDPAMLYDFTQFHFVVSFGTLRFSSSRKQGSMLYSLSMTVRMARAGMPPPWNCLPVGLE